MPTEPMTASCPLSRRRLLGTTASLAAGAAAAPRLMAGAFSAGGDRLRVGLVGCGGRGTGAAAQALAADPAVRLVAIGDLDPTQVATAAVVLGRTAADRFICPRELRFSGADAWRRVIDSDIDLVILATPPDCRPRHLAAAVAAGRHAFCEMPAAIDDAGAATIAAACATARSRGLSVMSGLAWRHDRRTAELITRLRDGAFGRPVAAHMASFVGLPWRQPASADASAAAQRRRNWITCPAQSGGDFVERQIHAIDKALWALGDEDPQTVEPLAPPAADGTAGVVFRFATGTTLTVVGGRRPHAADLIAEVVHCDRGACDLRGCDGAERHQATMATLIHSLLSGRHVDDGAILGRATAAALLGRAAAAGRRLPWSPLAMLQPV